MSPTKSNRQPKFSERYLNYLSTISKQDPAPPEHNSPSSSTKASQNHNIFRLHQFLQFYTNSLHNHHHLLTSLNQLLTLTSHHLHLILHPTILISHIFWNPEPIPPKCLKIRSLPNPRITLIIYK